MEEQVVNSLPATTTRLLIVDDHRLHCAGTKMLFHGVWFIGEVATADEPREAVGVARRFKPHVTLMDITLPLPGPFESAREIMAMHGVCRVIFLDDSFRRVNLQKALQVGASGYLTKHVTFEETCEAVRRVAAGQTTFCPVSHRHADETHVGPHFMSQKAESPLDSLTPREMEVLLHLGEGLTARECAVQMNLAQSTVENHKSRMMKKLKVRNMAQLVRLAVYEGLL